MKVYIGSDHGGFELKQQLASWLAGEGYDLVDLGPQELDPNDDYPLIAAKLAEAVQSKPGSRGILLCRSGQGVCIVANKFAGIRAALAWEPEAAVRSREDDDANILCLPADFLHLDVAQEIATVWLTTLFEEADKYERRLAEIARIEQANFHG